jgi:hypothetical protein
VPDHCLTCRNCLAQAGFDNAKTRDRGKFAAELFAETLRQMQEAGGSLPLGVHVAMEESAPMQISDMVENIAIGEISDNRRRASCKYRSLACFEPFRASRRLVGLSQAAMADPSCWQKYAASNSAGGMLTMDSSDRRSLNHPTHGKLQHFNPYVHWSVTNNSLRVI